MTFDDILNPFDQEVIPLSDWVKDALDWLVESYRPFFQGVRRPISEILNGFEWLLNAVPDVVMLVILGLACWRIGGVRLAVGTVVLATFLGLIGVWAETMTTLAIVFTSVAFCLMFGFPLGVLAARSDPFDRLMRPVLDAMQTIPSFVYLVPVVMLFGIGNVSGVIVTIVFAIPPIIRLTNLGIRQVSRDVVEASLAVGASPIQILLKVEIPLAIPTIMAGVNQTLMMALSMVVVASMISVGGLGQMVLRGIGRLDMGLATVGGLGVVILAIVLDRMTQAVSTRNRNRRLVSKSGSGTSGVIRALIGADTR